LLSIIIAILTIIVSPIDSKGKIVHTLSKIFSGGILLISGVKLNVKGREMLNPFDKYIFVSNHQSNFDIPIMMQAVPNVLRFVYKKQLTKIPIFGWGMYLGQYIPIDRKDARNAIASLKKAALKVKKGISVALFPEGTRSLDGQIHDFKKGIFILAEEACEKIVPVTIKGSFNIMPKNSLRINPGRVSVTFSAPLEFKKDKYFLQEIRQIIINNYDQ
jgi:1-acyl-sn-glycerol-3-phosphate acyltransferase